MSTVKAGTKICSLCKIEKPQSEFYGRHAKCSQCWNAIRRERNKVDPRIKEWNSISYTRHREERLERQKRYNKENKEAIAKRKSQKWQENREENLIKSRQRYIDNRDMFLRSARKQSQKDGFREKMNAYRRSYYATEHGKSVIDMHRAKRRLNVGKVYEISEKDIRRIFQMGCVICGNEEVTLDHIIPIARGGSHSIGNLQPLCRSHNASKGKKLMIEWKQYLKKLEMVELVS